jgi:hypothetical protein
MINKQTYYGHYEKKSYPLATYIWGHRLRNNQHWMEYLLEFLNILDGFNYQLGRGIDADQGSSLEKYKRWYRLGLRRFVFYSKRDKAHQELDNAALSLQEKRLQDQYIAGGDNGEKIISYARDLFLSLTAVEDDRSWFAKSLRPMHHQLLFWEGRAERAKLPLSARTPLDYDKHISLGARNFFARGGEIYYLILSAGSQDGASIGIRNKITSKLHTLLNRNKEIGDLAEIINTAWYEGPENRTGEGDLGWIFDPSCALYRIIVEDVVQFLENDLDTSESFDLMAYLINFHLIQYIYHRAQPCTSSGQHDARCLASCRPHILVDMAESGYGGPIRGVSERLFRQQGFYQEQKAKGLLETYVRECLDEQITPNLVPSLYDPIYDEITLEGGKSKRRLYDQNVYKLQKQLSNSEIDLETFFQKSMEMFWNAITNDFDEHFLGIHRKLAKSIGFVSPRSGPGARFVLGDSLLRTLVLANIEPGKQMPFDAFLERLYDRYGIIVGSEEARRSSLDEQESINTDYYDINRSSLLEKMKRAGLVTQYSDATALVQGTIQ